MNLVERIKAKTPRKNKIWGRISTAVCGVALMVTESGLVDDKPVIKLGLRAIGMVLGVKAGYDAQTVLK